MMKLEQAAQAPDDAFPSMLFNPLTNDFGDLYFKLDLEDLGQEAVLVDPRFTRKNIQRIRGTIKRIDRYLEMCALYDDYVDYLVAKYGSLEMVDEMYEAGILKDPPLPINHRPILRKGKIRKLFKSGIIPSFAPYGVDTTQCFTYLKEICDRIEDEKVYDVEPDIEWSLNRKPSKKEMKVLERNTERYRRQRRLEILNSGTSVNGITSNMDFIDNYYANVHRGVYDTEFSDADKSESSITGQMKAMKDREYWHEGKIAEAQDATQRAKLSFDGAKIHNRDAELRYEILEHLQKYTGIDVIGTMTDRGMSKKNIKAVRAGLTSIGADTGLTKKERKKLKKKQRKVQNMQSQAIRNDQRLQEVLLNNKIMLNGGTVRFEDMRRRRDY